LTKLDLCVNVEQGDIGLRAEQVEDRCGLRRSWLTFQVEEEFGCAVSMTA